MIQPINPLDEPRLPSRPPLASSGAWRYERLAEPAATVEHAHRPQAGREAWIDWVRVVGAVAIVVLHVTAREKVWRAGELGRFEWWALSAYEGLTRIAVPLFFMVSGHLILRRCCLGTNAGYAVKRALKTYLFALAWTLIFSFWEILRGRNDSVLGYVQDAALGAPYYHLWFLYAIATTYLVAPIVAPGLKAIPDSRAHLVGWLLPILVSLDFLIARIQGERFGGTSFISIGVPYISLTASGYLLARSGPHLADRFAVGIYLAGFVACQLIYGLLAENSSDVPDGTVFGVFSPTIVMMSLAAYGLVSRWKFATQRQLPRLFQAFANDSLAIYILHPFVMDTLNYFRIYGREPTALIGIAWMSLLVVAATWCVVTVIKRIPLVRILASL